MATPSLGELSNLGQPVRVNPEPYIIDTKSTIDVLNNAANQKAQYDWKKYLNFQDNLKEAYKNLDDTSALKAAQEDRPMLQQEMGKVFSEIADNPEAFSGKNPQLYGQIQSKLSKLKSTATQSAQDKLFDDVHRNYLAQNPELNTDENAALVQGYLKKPLGQRQAYTLKMPTIFDANLYTQDGLKNATTEFAGEPQLVGAIGADGKPGIGDEFIREWGGKKISQGQFLNYWNGGLETQTDKYGHSIKSAVRDMFKRLPPDQQEQYKGDYQNWWKQQGVNKFNSLGTPDENGVITIIDKDKYTQNPNFLEKEKYALNVEKEKFDQWAAKQHIGIDYLNATKEDKQNQDAATSIIRLGVGILNDAVKPENKREIFDGVGKKNRTVYELSNPTLLKQFGTIDKNGNVTNPPDRATFDPITKKINLTYEIKLGGKPRIEEKPLTIGEWTQQLVKGTYGEGKSGDIFGKVERIVNDNGGDLFEVSKKFKPQSQEKTYNVGGNTLTESQLQKGADKYAGGNIETYKKQLGIK